MVAQCPQYRATEGFSFLPGWREKTFSTMTDAEATQLFAELDACISVRGRPN